MEFPGLSLISMVEITSGTSKLAAIKKVLHNVVR